MIETRGLSYPSYRVRFDPIDWPPRQAVVQSTDGISTGDFEVFIALDELMTKYLSSSGSAVLSLKISEDGHLILNESAPIKEWWARDDLRNTTRLTPPQFLVEIQRGRRITVEIEMTGGWEGPSGTGTVVIQGGGIGSL